MQPKLKLKLSEKAGTMASGTSFLGPYDRELDSDDEDLAFEEQFILRLPPGEDCDKLRKSVLDREIGNDVWFKFKGRNIPIILRYPSHSITLQILVVLSSTSESLFIQRNWLIFLAS